MSARSRLVSISTAATLLAGFSLSPLLAGWGWVLPVIAVVVVPVAVCEAARRVGLARPFVPLAGLLALLVWLVVTTAGDFAPYGVVPSPGAIARLVEVMHEGFRAVDRYTAPVSANRGIMLLTTGGMGLVALAVDTIAVTLRRPALAGLPLLALYGIPAGLAPHGVPWSAFALGAGGYLFLLLSESGERVLRWGRPLESKATGDEPSPLLALGRRVGAGAVTLAIAVPVFVPGLNGGALNLGSGTGIGGNGNGGGSLRTAVNPVVTLKDDLVRKDKRPILHFTSTARSPYIRLVVLDNYDGVTWSPRTLRGLKSNPKKSITAPWYGLENLASTVKATTTISIEKNFSSVWLPMTYPATKLHDAAGSWVYDPDTLNTYSKNRDASGLTYSVDSLDANLTKADLVKLAANPPNTYRPDARYIETPKVSTRIVELASKITTGKTTDYDRAVALQNYLHTNYRYSVKAPGGTGEEQLEQFLLYDRAGFCTHFATAMAVMARTLGIPSRVAVGFLPGADDGKVDKKTGLHEHLVTTAETHAWPELYFAGAGWLRFEPTPGNGTIGPAYAPNTAPFVPTGQLPQVAGSGGASVGPSTGAGAGSSAKDPHEKPVDASAASTGSGHHVDIPWRLLVLVPALLLLALLPAVWRSAVRRRRWAAATTPALLVAAAWAELGDSLVDRRHRLDDRETPRQLAARIGEAALAPSSTAALQRIAHHEERRRYARGVGDVSGVRSDLAVVLEGLDATAGRLDRLRSTWLPASSVSALHVLGGWFADLFDGIDRALARARSRLIPRRS